MAILFCGVIASSVYIFDPEASWNLLLGSLPVPAPETQPLFGIEPIHQFFLLLDAKNREIYLYYEGFVDALFFLSIVGFSLCLYGLALKRSSWLQDRGRWILMLPILLLGFELLEGATLLSIMHAAPNRVEPLLVASDIATAGKMASYLLVFLANFIALGFLAANVVRRRN